ncbi:hypothetical protein LMG26411_07728 [Cupriavidus numazuensis]|uniref:PNPLA domain-containing protein n=1 Tax=Cupriavidus numazuensis TaxID=221992 RepID=A0ABM8TVT4_9BURK|nr:hypothetical protein LMG26411_07728 [Cupriavidus numazuensis]
MPADDHGFGDEAARIAQRRRQLGIPARPGGDGRNWALALSGGGIRSATFCLGVLQALAGTPRPKSDAEPEPEPEREPPGAPAPTSSLLAQFDYLSTVSGGGYLGAFFTLTVSQI